MPNTIHQINRPLNIINADIYTTLNQLERLYRERAGRMSWDPATGNILLAYCTICGKRTVDATHGFDTCNPCKKEI